MKASRWVLIALLAMLTVPVSGWSAVYTFSDQDFYGGASWGTLSVTQADPSTLLVRFDFNPTSPAIALGSPDAQVTGFGFSFKNLLPVSITNPGAAFMAGDRDDLNWTVLGNLNAIPNPSNGDEFDPAITKDSYMFGATEGNPNNINPPGVNIGGLDVFYLNFAEAISEADVTLTGIRIQSIDDRVNGGSLFLAGGPPRSSVSEPATLMLLGSGLVGLAVMGRRHRRG
jgi:hypothetical protein